MSAPPRLAPAAPRSAAVLVPLVVTALLLAPPLAGPALLAPLGDVLPGRLLAVTATAGPVTRVVAGFLLLVPVGSVAARRTGRPLLGVLAGVAVAALCAGVES